jgi:hypothetical protein
VSTLATLVMFVVYDVFNTGNIYEKRSGSMPGKNRSWKYSATIFLSIFYYTANINIITIFHWRRSYFKFQNRMGIYRLCRIRGMGQIAHLFRKGSLTLNKRSSLETWNPLGWSTVKLPPYNLASSTQRVSPTHHLEKEMWKKGIGCILLVIVMYLFNQIVTCNRRMYISTHSTVFRGGGYDFGYIAHYLPLFLEVPWCTWKKPTGDMPQIEWTNLIASMLYRVNLVMVWKSNWQTLWDRMCWQFGIIQCLCPFPSWLSEPLFQWFV